MSFMHALNFVRHQRSIVHPNQGFAAQLQKYEKDKQKLNEKVPVKIQRAAEGPSEPVCEPGKAIEESKT
jgi:hypothetical protein